MRTTAFTVPAGIARNQQTEHRHISKRRRRLSTDPVARRPSPRRTTPYCTGWSAHTDDTQRKSDPQPRPDRTEMPASCIPQTIEYALLQAKDATSRALCDGICDIRVEMPMGRARSHWYVLSPISAWYAEAATLAFHYAEMFKGLHITMVLGSGPGVTHPVAWIATISRIEDPLPPPDPAAEHRVVIFAAVSPKQKSHLQDRLDEIVRPDATILFNSFMETPLTVDIAPFQMSYISRTMDKIAVLRMAHNQPWDVFVEIAVFEFEWVGQKALSESWKPSVAAIESFARARGACSAKGSDYYNTRYSGCEAGFWPFMTISSRNVLPLDGTVFEREERAKQQGKLKNPFGFF